MHSVEKWEAIATAVAGRRRQPVRRPVWLLPCAIVAVMLWQSPIGQAATLFDRLLGSWTGSGQIHYDDGQSERIMCAAYYKGGGNELRLAIRCKGDSDSQVEIRGQLRAEGGELAGRWEERRFNAAGKASGSMVGNKISLAIDGGGFKGAMTVTSAGSRQTVTISADGIGMRSVNVTLGKS